MEQLLNLSLSYLTNFAIRLYQVFISNKISRNCIYEITCSHRAIAIVNSKASLRKKFQLIKQQISGCKIVEIVSLDIESWKVINGNGDCLSPDELNEHTRLDIYQTLSQFYESQSH